MKKERERRRKSKERGDHETSNGMKRNKKETTGFVHVPDKARETRHVHNVKTRRAFEDQSMQRRFDPIPAPYILLSLPEWKKKN